MAALPSAPRSPRGPDVVVGAFLVVAIALGLAACHGAHPPAQRPGPAPTPAALLAELRAQQARVTTLDARVRATSWLSGERLRATVNILADRTGRLRFEAEVSLQGTVAVLTTNGGQFASLDLQKNTLIRGPACPAAVASLVKIPLLPEEVAAILMGDVAVPAARGEPRVSWDAQRGLDRLEVAGRDGSTAAILFDPLDATGTGTRHLRGVVVTHPDGKTWWRTSYEDFGDVAPAGGGAPVSLPALVRFAEGDRSFDDGVDVKFKDRRVGAALADGAFTLEDKPGVVTSWTGCPEEVR